MNFIRHGDVDIRPVEKIPKSACKTESRTLAYGEVTGHRHSFSSSTVQVFEAQMGDTIKVGDEQIQVVKYIDVKQDSVLEHQEHNPVTVPKGMYAVLQEREYNPFDQEIRRVLD